MTDEQISKMVNQAVQALKPDGDTFFAEAWSNKAKQTIWDLLFNTAVASRKTMQPGECVLVYCNSSRSDSTPELFDTVEEAQDHIASIIEESDFYDRMDGSDFDVYFAREVGRVQVKTKVWFE